MIEIALSLAIIGFALVAIIGILPIGMNTQKANREETVVNQDATVWLNAIRNGAKGLDDLTNYVVAITNYVTEIDPATGDSNLWAHGYTYTSSSVSPPYLLNSGLRIIGLLGTPKYMGDPTAGKYTNNQVCAYVRSLSGPASEKSPQTNAAVQELGFNYRLTSEVVPNGRYYVDPYWIGTPMDATLAKSFGANLHEVRLLFRWPLQPEGRLGKGGQSYRMLVGGQLVPIVEPGFPRDPEHTLYFFDPHNYVKVP